MSAQGVTWIVHNLKPHVEDYFDQVIDDGYWENKQCHRSYEYPSEVTYQKCWPHFGIFYDYLIRREIYVRLGEDIVDKRAEMFKDALQEYDQKLAYGYRMDNLNLQDGTCISTTRKNINNVRKFLNSYETFQDPEYRTEDILEDIFNTSMLHMMYFGRRIVQFGPELITWSNIQEVVKYVRTWYLGGIRINPTVSGDFFFGDADLVFPSCIMDIKLSKYNPSDKWSTFKRGIYQMLFYAKGIYDESGREIRKFKVYNPLLGAVHILNLPQLDFDDLSWNLEEEEPYYD